MLLFVSSVAAQEAQRGQAAYGGSKGAINGIMMPMARDLGKYGIRVAAVAPGVFYTPMTNLPSFEKIKKKLESQSPMNRMGYPDEFAHFV